MKAALRNFGAFLSCPGLACLGARGLVIVAVLSFLIEIS